MDVVGPLLLTLRIAFVATVLILPPAVGLAWLLARRPWPGKAVVEAVVTLPLVLPPTAVGLGLLVLLGRQAPLGRFLQETLGLEIVFTWKAAVLAAAVVAFPLLARSARTAFEEVDPRLPALARSLGRGSLNAFLTVELPLAWRGLMAGTVLAFARALGEFGATILIAGNIPGETQTLALALFQHVQVGRETEALVLAGVSALLAAGALVGAEALSRRRERRLAR